MSIKDTEYVIFKQDHHFPLNNSSESLSPSEINEFFEVGTPVVYNHNEDECVGEIIKVEKEYVMNGRENKIVVITTSKIKREYALKLQLNFEEIK